MTLAWCGDRTTIPALLNAALADELVCVLCYDLAAKRSAIESYGDMIDLVDEKDPRTRCLLHWILAQEREHADALEGLLKSFPHDEARG
ncbi:MAG: ferritin-like domain-containing protein [Thermoanaerobaculia bacterium]